MYIRMGLSSVGWPYCHTLFKIHIRDCPKHTCQTMFKRKFTFRNVKGHRQVGHAPKCRCIYLVYLMPSCNKFSARKPLGHLTVCLWVHLKLKLQNSQYIFWVWEVCSTRPRNWKKKRKTSLSDECWYFEKHFKKLTNFKKFNLDSHSCIHRVSHPVYATGSTTHRTIIL
jgi:hypothetical protein